MGRPRLHDEPPILTRRQLQALHRYITLLYQRYQRINGSVPTQSVDVVIGRLAELRELQKALLAAIKKVPDD